MGYTAIQHLVKYTSFKQRQETRSRIGMLDLPYEEEYRVQLKHLGYKEKDILKEAFQRQEWNVGSARVLSFLQEANVLTASEYILSLDSIELIQQIMNDLLETEYSLLAHIIRYAYQDNVQSISLTNILKDSFRSLLSDLNENPNVIPHNYLQAIKNHLLTYELKTLVNEHLQLVLFECEGMLDLSDAIGCQQQWREEMHTKLTGTVLESLLIVLVHDKGNLIDMLKELTKIACPFSLKHTLYLISLAARATTIDELDEKLLKSFMKDLFRAVVETGLMSKMQLLLLYAREICTTNAAVIGTYPAWYKQTIGEMTYSVKKDQFISTMELLTALIPAERNPEMLGVHATIAISAPAKCNDYVLNYKQLCRAHIAQLKSPECTIVLED
uniref:Fanconi anaemia group A protein N-terminal domain-containing protein n=1 Tax=Anopheles christyi TaxID=43041 RepID=A0A182KAL5_9DIPT